jgi:hypothetical protein
MEENKDLQITAKELANIDSVAQNIVQYSEDDRRKADSLFDYYQELIEGGDKKGETREALAKALELRENSVNNLVEILKLKTRLLEKKMVYEMRQMSMERDVGTKGKDTSDLIARFEESS